jgi:hypothetical protein
MGDVGQLLVELAADEDLFGPLIAAMLIYEENLLSAP